MAVAWSTLDNPSAGQREIVGVRAKAVKQVNVLLRGGPRNQVNHVFDFRLGDHLGRELRIHQNDVGANRLNSPYTVADQEGGFRTS
jgi:hypothetical protein